MQYSVVHLSTAKVHPDFRIDADYFKPRYQELEKLLLDKETADLNTYSTFIKKGIFDISPSSYVEAGGVAFLRSGDLKDELISSDNIIQISKESHTKEKKTELVKNDLLMAKVGTIGDVSINLRFERLNFSQNVMGIKIKKQHRPISGFLLSFLNCSYGKTQVNRVLSGQLQQKLTLEDIRKIKIVTLDYSIQKLISNLVYEAYLSKERAKDIYAKTEQLLLSELGLLDWEQKHELAFVKNFSTTQEAERFDAEYFQPKYEDIIKAVRQCTGGFDELGDLVDINKSVEPGRDAYKNTGVPFVRVSNLSKFEISTNNQQCISDEMYSTLKDHQPSQGEILLSKDATPGIAYHLNTLPQKMIPSSGILRLRVTNPKVIPEYLTLLLNSVIVQEQIKRDSGGSIITHWRPDQVRAVSIPVLGQDKQGAIKKSIEKSFEARRLSKNLLEVAKRGVEIAIEKNEQEAEKWINSEVAELPRGSISALSADTAVAVV